MKKRILIIEDDAPIREALTEFLEDEQYTVTQAENGKEALELLSSQSELPQLILLDLMMPVMDGIQFRVEQRKDQAISHIPVILMTADRYIDNHKAQIQAAHYFSKPIDIDKLLEVMEQTLQA